jgi:hypothetical protein
MNSCTWRCGYAIWNVVPTGENIILEQLFVIVNQEFS